MAKVRVLPASEIAPGEVRVVECGDRSLALACLGDDAFGAIDNLCTHDNGPLGEGRLVNGRVVCPRHGASFDAVTGQVKALPAVRDVRGYAATVEDGYIVVECPDGDA